MSKHRDQAVDKKRGASGLSYGLVVGLVSIVALGAVTSVGSSVDNLMTETSDTLAGPAGLAATPTPQLADETPDGFDFTDEGVAPLSAEMMSDIVQVNGHDGVNVSVSGDGGPEFRTCDDAACSVELTGWGTSQQTLAEGDYVQMRLTAASSTNVAYTAQLTVGDQTVDWEVTTADCTNTAKQNFGSSGKSVLAIPAGCTMVTVKAWGAGGGGSSGSNSRGGGGGFASGSFNVTPGATLNIYVGGGGGSGYNSSNTGGGYGGGGGASHHGGGGGGRSLVALDADPTDPLVIAGGGGGGGWNNAHGGAGGGQAGWGNGSAGAGGQGGQSNGTGGAGAVGGSYSGGNGGSWASGEAGNGGRGSSQQYATGGTPTSAGTSYDQYAYPGGHGADYGGGGGGGSCSGSGNNTYGTGTGGGTVHHVNACHNPGGGGSAGGGGGGSVHGGGGGGGYGGGGGGAHSYIDGGGGGSSYVRSTDRIGNATLTTGNSQVPGNTGDTDYISPRAYGGSGANQVGDPGLVVLIFGN